MSVCRARRLGQKLLGDPPADWSWTLISRAKAAFEGFLQATGMEWRQKKTEKKKRDQTVLKDTHGNRQMRVIRT